MLRHEMVIAVGVSLLVPITALAADAGGAMASADQELLRDKIDRLEGLIEQQDARLRQQDEKIESLQNQLTAGDGTLDEARVNQIKKLIREVIADSEFRESLFPDQVRGLLCELYGNNWGKKFLSDFGEDNIRAMLLATEQYIDRFAEAEEIDLSGLPEPIKREHARVSEDIEAIAAAIRRRKEYEHRRMDQV